MPTPLSSNSADPSPASASPPIVQALDRTAKRPYPLRIYAARMLWAYVGSKLFRWSLPRSFAWRRWLLRRFGTKLTPTSVIYNSVEIFHPWWLELGNNCTLAHQVVIYNLGPISIGSHTVLSQGVYLCAGSHDYTQPHLPLLRPPIHIGSGVWIAAQAFIGPDVTVNDNSVVGARAVVFKDVPAGMIVAGNPARVIKPREMNVPPTDEPQVPPA